MRQLTLKQSQFVDLYLKYRNATAAAAESYGAKNRSTASVIGYENLRKPQIREEIRRRLNGDGTSWNVVLTLFDALHAETEEGYIDWPTRLRAADLVLRYAYDPIRNEKQP